MTAAASNAVSDHQVLPVKPSFDPSQHDTEMYQAEAPAQPVRKVDPMIEQETSDPPAESNTMESSEPHGSLAGSNGVFSVGAVNEMTSGLREPSPPAQAGSNLLSTQEPESHPSLFASSSSVLSNAPSSVLAETQMSTGVTTLPLELPDLAAEPPLQVEQAPISDLRTPLQPESLSAENAQQIKDEKEKQDLASDSGLAQSLATGGNDPIERTLSSAQPSPPQLAPVDQEPPPALDEDSKMDVSFDAPPVADIPLASPPAFSPPPPPEPALATLESEQPRDPAPTPALPSATFTSEEPHDLAPVPVLSSTTLQLQADHQMMDAPSPPTKISRERDEDEEDIVPSAKRTKTEAEVDAADEEFKKPDLPQSVQSPATPNGDGTYLQTFEEGADDITSARLAHMKKIISNLKKGNSSLYFRTPVDPVALKIPNYPNIVKDPMDLGTIDSNLKNQKYSSVKEFVDDFQLIVDNCVAFNGPDHAITESAKKMENSFRNQMNNMPPAGVSEPSREEKRAQKVKEQPTRAVPARRTSTSVAAPVGTARSPTATTPSQTFALGPEGVPLIRRDSNVADGRPKRAILPPKRNQDFGGGRPKKKKFELQLKFCAEILSEIKKQRHWMANQYFLTPVDPVALNIPTYFQIIKKPMDLSTVQHKLDVNDYEKAKDFEDDVRLIFKNCYKFNQQGDLVYSAGQQLEKLFNEKWEEKDSWIAAREPTSEPQSPDEDDEDEEESEEEEEENSEDERLEKIALLQKQMEMMGKQMSELAQPKKKKKPTPPAVPTKKGSKSSKSGKKEKQPPTFPALQSSSSSSSKKPKKPIVKDKPMKDRFVTYSEKQYISNGITQLNDQRMQQALDIIQANVPHLKNTAEAEVELDIDELPNHVLLKLLGFVKKHVPQAAPEPPQPEPVYTAAATGTAAPSKPKKNKPMSKHEQEAQIEELKGKLGVYTGGGPISPEPRKFYHVTSLGGRDSRADLYLTDQSIENNNDSSGDEDDSEESEEE